MGMFKRSYWSNTSPQAGEPVPWKFFVEKEEKVGGYWVSIINYPDCDNFEGNKILVTHYKPSGRSNLDPHFLENNDVLARFRPDSLGWDNAVKFVKAIS